MIFQRFSQNKYKRKRENRCHITLKPLKGGRANGFGSSRSLNNRFCGLRRKNKFGPKLREAKRTFSFFFLRWKFPFYVASPSQIEAQLSSDAGRCLGKQAVGWRHIRTALLCTITSNVL